MQARAQGACPTGANYINPANVTGALVTLSSGYGVSGNNCWFAYSGGSDSNTCTTEASPCQHFPGMTGCTSTCSSITKGSGIGWIIEGGSHYHYSSGTPTIGSWSVTTSGSSGNQFFIGPDLTWYSGGSFARPIFDMDNPQNSSTVSSCTFGDDGNSMINLGSTTNVVVYGLEGTGTCGTGSGFAAMFSGGTTDLEIHNYFHGWTETTTASDDKVSFVSGGGTSRTILNVVDGSDSTFGTTCTNSACVQTGTCGGSNYVCNGATGWAFVSCYDMEYNIVFHTSQGCEASNITLVIGNNFQYIFEPSPGGSYTSRHGNILETITTASSSFTAYDNTTCNVNNGETWDPASQVMVIFNNVFCNDGHFPPNPNGLMLEPNPSNSSAIIAVTLTNNTFDNTVASSTDGTTWASGSSMTIENLHIVGRTTFSGFFACQGSSSCPVTDNGGEIYMTTANAAAQGYNNSNFWSPTAGTNSTVGAGNNMTSQCATYSSDNALCSSVRTAQEESGWGGEIAVIPSANARPSSSAWDAGAYEFTSASIPSAPSPAIMISQWEQYVPDLFSPIN